MSPLLGGDGNVAKEIGRVIDWQGKLWDRRGVAIPELSDADSVDRLSYVISQGVKENAVERAESWPGPHAGKAFVTGKPERGIWIDRSALYEKRRVAKAKGGKRPTEEETTTLHKIKLAKLPCWRPSTSGVEEARFPNGGIPSPSPRPELTSSRPPRSTPPLRPAPTPRGRGIPATPPPIRRSPPAASPLRGGHFPVRGGALPTWMEPPPGTIRRVDLSALEADPGTVVQSLERSWGLDLRAALDDVDGLRGL